MEKMKSRLICGLVVFGAFLWLLSSKGEAATWNFECGGMVTLQEFINTNVNSGDTIFVSGTCNENIYIGRGKDNITLDGGGSATINAADANKHVASVYGRGISIKGFTIAGGNAGIDVLAGGTATINNNIIGSNIFGIIVGPNSFAVITNNIIENNSHAGILITNDSFARIGMEGGVAQPNTIQNNGTHGITVASSSSATIVWNTILNNTGMGIWIGDNSTAFMGITSPNDTVAQPNSIQSNGDGGVMVSQSSSTRIVGNTISNNTGDGVGVFKGSQADISNNNISGNSGNGIQVSQSSGVNLGNDTGTTIFDSPNTTTVRNGQKGIICSIGGYGDGRLGTLTGVLGRVSFATGCINSLIP